MKYTCIDLKYARLHIIKTKKFRTINVKVLLQEDFKKEDITKRNFLIDYLVLTTNNYKTKRELALKIQELYSLYISGNNMRLGNRLVTKFNMSLLDPKYTEDEMLLESFKLLHEIIFNPHLENQQFALKPFNIIKKDLEATLKTYKENARIYSISELFKNMDSDRPYSYNGFGYQEDLDLITPKNLYEYYKDFLKQSLVDIYVIGDVKIEEIKKIVKDQLNFKTLKSPKKDIYIYHDKLKRTPKEVIEKANFNQSKLALACKLKDLSEFEQKYVINLYSMILGGGFNSKLMQIIREKESLAYYITSNVNKPDNILLIQSGISSLNYKKVIKHIKDIMKSIEKGMVTQEELQNVKTEYLSILEETYDNIDSILENYITIDLLKTDDMETKREMIGKVTISDIVSLAKKIKIDTIYLLEGGSNEKN